MTLAVEFQTPKISFIVTCFNKALFIRECLLSIKEQTYLNREIIVVNDFSTDESLNIVEQFAKENQDITVKIIKIAIQFINVHC